VRHLEEERAPAAEEQRRLAVDAPADAFGAEEARAWIDATSAGRGP